MATFFKRVFSLILLLVIIGSSLFLYAQKQAQGPLDNSFNTNTRPKLVKYPLVREVFNFNDFGDARSDYLGPTRSSIEIHVAVMQEVTLDHEVLERFRNEVENITKKSVEISFSEAFIPYDKEVSKEKALVLMESFDKSTKKDTPAVLNVLYLSAQSDNERLLGETYRENGIFIFKESHEALTQDFSKVLDEYEYGTLLHEFGHQLGLDHNNDPTCLMYLREDTLEPLRIIRNESDVIQNFCEDEFVEIEKIKDSVN